MRAVKVRAAHEGRKLKTVMADLVERGLAAEPAAAANPRARVALPLVHNTHEARPDEEMTPERVAAVLEAEEVAAARSAR